MKTIPYEYKNMPIPGGGYVTGFVYSKTEKNVLYIRTDIGGTYRFDYEKQTWKSLIDHVTMEDLSETFPISVCIDDAKPGSLYIASGVNRRKTGVLAISEDYGETFRYETIPVMVHGNLNGRGTAERLYVEGDEIWFASQMGGLWHSLDLGKTWEKAEGLAEQYLTFVTKVRGVLIVGTAGVTTACQAMHWPNQEETKGFGLSQPFMRGHSLYCSRDGVHFDVMNEPKSYPIPGCKLNGQVAQRWSVDDKYLYVTFASTGRTNYVIENGYSCDSGDNIDGHIVRYDLDYLGNPHLRGQDITPGRSSRAEGSDLEKLTPGCVPEFGFSGICVSEQTPGMLVATTLVRWEGDSVFRSMDYGETWTQVLYGLTDGEISFRAPYMRPECNGGGSLIHWLSDFKINPFNDNEGWFNSGTGVFRTENLKDEKCVKFTDWCDGIEETVHLNVYSLPKGEVQALAILGDLGGFAFKEVDKPCGNSFADAEGNRYITCINADFSDENPAVIVVTPRGNWTGKTFGGLILSKNQGDTWQRLPMPFGLTADLDEALHLIEKPNVNSGWVAMSPDCQSIVWSVAKVIDLPAGRVITSKDGGQTFTCTKIFDLEGKEKTTGKMKAFSDRVDSELFYGFGEASQFYVSRDGGLTFVQKALPAEFPVIEFGLIDCANKTEVRVESGKTGVIYMAIGAEGIWKLTYDKAADSVSLQRLTKPGITAFRMGLGLGAPDADYFKDAKAIYFNGIVDGTYGFYRSLDDGATFERLNTDRQMYGEINSIDGDCRTFGRFFLATGSNGVKYGDQI